jgi:2-isopropylmalate synthase
MRVYERQPYSGSLVFAAFSGSHQDAIAKGMHYREDKNQQIWNVPYLPIDPKDVGREYEADVIRINSQSGKGGIGYLMETAYSLILPPKMREVFGYHVKSVSDHAHKELQPCEVYDIFMKNYVNVEHKLAVPDVHFIKGEGVKAAVTFHIDGGEQYVVSKGNGSLDAVSNAIKTIVGDTYSLESYTEHALEDGSTSRAASYVAIKANDTGRVFWGVGIDSDIIISSVKALVSAVNRMLDA